MTLTALAGLALLQLLITMSPGPAVILSIRTAAVEGPRTGLALGLGLSVAVVIWASAALAGLSIVFELMPWVQTALRVAGAVFLIWIAVNLWRHAAEELPESNEKTPCSPWRAFLLGLWGNLANPKALAYFAAVFVGLIPGEISGADAIAILGVIFLVEAIWYSCLALVFSRPAPRRVYALLKSRAERLFGVILSAFGLRLLIER